MSTWFVYIVRCADKTLYTGITIDALSRVRVHNSGKGAKYTRARRPVRLVYKEAMATGTAARQREAQIKKMTRAEKIKLVKRRRRSSAQFFG